MAMRKSGWKIPLGTGVSAKTDLSYHFKVPGHLANLEVLPSGY